MARNCILRASVTATTNSLTLRNNASPGSDLNLMVILPGKPDPFAERVRLRRAIGSVGAGVDVLVFSEEEAAQRGQVPGTVIYWANREGKVLYEAPRNAG
jgi:hypothetical protein